MWFWRKFVSASIVLAVLSVPLVSLASCVPESADAMQCPPDCPMMAPMNSSHQGMEMKAELAGSCCRIDSSKPVPVTESQLVPPAVSAVPVIAVISLVASHSSDHAAVTDTSPPSISDSQARLCTFQI